LGSRISDCRFFNPTRS